MVWFVMSVIDMRFWSSEDCTTPPTPPTAAPCRVAEAVNIVDLPIQVTLISGSSCRGLVCVLEYKSPI